MNVRKALIGRGWTRANDISIKWVGWPHQQKLSGSVAKGVCMYLGGGIREKCFLTRRSLKLNALLTEQAPPYNRPLPNYSKCLQHLKLRERERYREKINNDDTSVSGFWASCPVRLKWCGVLMGKKSHKYWNCRQVHSGTLSHSHVHSLTWVEALKSCMSHKNKKENHSQLKKRKKKKITLNQWTHLNQVPLLFGDRASEWVNLSTSVFPKSSWNVFFYFINTTKYIFTAIKAS